MSFSKKYQSVIITSILVALFLIILSLVVMPSGKTSLFKKLIFEVIAPLEHAVTSSVDGLGRVWTRYIFLVGLENENSELRREISSLTRRINSYQESYLEGERLRNLMDLREKLNFQTIAARIVGRERSSVFKTVLINKGSSDGIKKGSPVLAREGVVGRIIDVSWNASKVLLLIDYNSNIDALVQNVRAQGILQGAGRAGCVLKYVQRLEDVKKGDSVVCSGLAGVYPKGLLLGTVAGVDREKNDLFQEIQVSPAVDVTKLEEVLVIVKAAEEK